MGIGDDFPTGRYTAEAAYAPILRAVGLTDGLSVFEHPDVVPWRTVAERENCTLDATLPDGRSVRLHVKRSRPTGRGGTSEADAEAEGFRLLKAAGIATAPLAATGVLPDGRSFVITEDLYDHAAADRLIDDGRCAFADLSDALADVAARLHDAGLHHRDLYPCHFFARADGPDVDVRLIDAGRVRPLPKILFPRRWVVKDLAQFWYGIRDPRATADERAAWLDRYAATRGLGDAAKLRREVEAKAASIARHDQSVRLKRPERDVSLVT